MSLFKDLSGTSVGSFLISLLGVRLKNSSGNLVIRNNSDTADAEVTASKVNVSGDGIVINSDAASSGNDWSVTINRSASQTQSITFTLPPDDGSPGQVIQTNGNGVLTFGSAATTSDLVHVDSTAVAFGDGSTVAMFTLPANAAVHKVRLLLDTPFNGTNPTLSVGVSGTLSKYMASTQNNLKGAAEDIYEVHPNKAPVGSTENLIITYASDSSSAGSCRIEVYYSNPA